MDTATAKKAAQLAASDLKTRLDIDTIPEVGFILGTGWGDLLEIEGEREEPMAALAGFDGLEGIQGHRRVVSYGRIGARHVIALRGRVHMNERPYDAKLAAAVRLQIQMLCELGVRTFVLTNAAGGLGDRAAVGEVVAVDGFFTLNAPDMPQFAGEFVSPDDVLDPELRRLAAALAPQDLTVREGGYAMLRGPFFEGRKYDKAALYASGVSCVGMSSLPEAIVIALYRAEGARALVLSHVTNNDIEEHSHEENLKRSKARAPKLAALLSSLARRA